MCFPDDENVQNFGSEIGSLISHFDSLMTLVDVSMSVMLIHYACKIAVH